MARSYLLVALPAFALFAACGSDDEPAPAAPGADAGSSSGTSGPGTSSGSIAETDCAALAKGLCDFGKRCLNGFLEETSCEIQATALCEHQRKLPGFSPTLVPASCVAAYSTTACTAAQTPVELTTETCRLRGSVADGASCEADGQCQSSDCRKAGGAACGTCQPFAAEGASCKDATCTPGTYCLSPKGGEATCQKPKALGEACAGNNACVFPNKCVAGSCKAPLADGATCTRTSGEDDPCEHSCIESSCAPSTSRFVKVNETCEGTTLICPATTSCFGPRGDRKCLLDGLLGEPCNDETGPECAPHLRCTAGRCEERALDACK